MSILAGKVQQMPHWNLKLIMTPKFMYDSEETHEIPATHLPFDHFEIDITYDQICLLTHCFRDSAPVIFNACLDDNQQMPEHELCIQLRGADIDNNFIVQGKTITLGIELDLYIEDIELSWYLNNHDCFFTQSQQCKKGTRFMSENGRLLVNIQTPIYPWLFENEQHIVEQYIQNL